MDLEVIINRINQLEKEELVDLYNNEEKRKKWCTAINGNEEKGNEHIVQFPTQLPYSDRFKLDYADVPKEHWAYEYIQWGNQRGLVYGYPDGYFRPDRKLTHGQLIVLLIRFQGHSLRTIGGDLHWTAPYYEKAISEGWLCSNKQYKPDVQTTVGEVAMTVCSFIDEEQYSQEAAVEFLLKQGLLKVREAPQNEITISLLLMILYLYEIQKLGAE